MTPQLSNRGLHRSNFTNHPKDRPECWGTPVGDVRAVVDDVWCVGGEGFVYLPKILVRISTSAGLDPKIRRVGASQKHDKVWLISVVAVTFYTNQSCEHRFLNVQLSNTAVEGTNPPPIMDSHASNPPSNTASSHPFTCNTCQVAFRSSDLQRTHMQSDWHRYNLKRRVASLPPLTSETFAEKVLANKATAAATAARASFEKMCEVCEKRFFSENAYANHLGSQKHKLTVLRASARNGGETDSMVDSTFSLGEPMENASTTASTVTVNGEETQDPEEEDQLSNLVESIKQTGLGGPSSNAQVKPADDTNAADDDEEHKANLNQCLFCNYLSPNLDLNATHMSRQHGFFIPEKEFLVDLPGLVNYLSETIVVLHQCLYCHKSVHTGLGVQTHMRDRGHCMVAYSTEEEQMDIGDFYDFRSTYSDDETDEDEDNTAGGVSLGAKRAVKTTTTNAKGEDVPMEDDEGWESDGSSLSSVPTDEITSVPIDNREGQYAKLHLHRHHSHTDTRPHKDTDGFHSHAHHTPRAVYHDEYELHLPSGRTAGHRSLKQYYRQNLRNYPSAEERAEQQRAIEQNARESDDEADDEDTSVAVAGHANDGRGRQVASRGNGGMGMIGVSDAKRKEVAAVEKREIQRARRLQTRYQAGNERANNHQKHFRDPLLQ